MENNILSREDCHNVIKKCISSDRFEIVNFKVKPFEDKEREYYKPDSVLEVSAKMSKNISRFRFFLKKFFTKYSSLNELFDSMKASEREIYFYRNFLPILSKTLQNYNPDFAPQYLLSRENDIMIMEDLSLRLYVVAKKVNPHLLDRFHLCLALKAVAKLHAGSLAYEEIKSKDPKISSLFGHKEDLLLQHPLWQMEDNHLGYKVLQSGIKGIQTLLAQLQQLEKLDASLNQKINDLFEKCSEIIKPTTKYRNVLCHGDLRTKNLLFKYEGTSVVECALLNFGYCRYFLPAYDVLTLIFLTSNKLFRQHYFTYLIQYYYDCLHNELLKQDMHVYEILTFEEFQQSINYLMPIVKLETVLHLQEHGAKEGFYKIMIKKDDNAYRHFLFEDKSEFVSEVIKKDPIFKLMIIDALEELLDTLNDSRISRENCYEILEKRLDTTVYDLNEFYLNPSKDDINHCELIMKVCLDVKEGIESEFKYLVECNSNNSFKVLSQIQ